MELCFISEGHKRILLLALSVFESDEVTTSQFVKVEVTMMECNPKTLEIFVVVLTTSTTLLKMLTCKYKKPRARAEC